MTARLQRIHAILRDGHVPSALESRPGQGVLLQAGSPGSEAWDVLVEDTGAQLWVHDAHGAVRLPPGVADAAVADTVKFHVVQARADEGDPEARALIAELEATGWRRGAINEHREAQAPIDVFAFLNPLQFAARMVDAASQFGNGYLTPQQEQVGFAVWSPCGTIQARYTRP
jgi:hypothetical protein